MTLQDQDEVTGVVGTRVRAARARRMLTRKQLATMADVSERYLNQLENGGANVSIGILAKVAAALDVDLAALLPAPQGSAGGVARDTAMLPVLSDVIGGLTPIEQQGAADILKRYVRERRRSLKGIALLGLRGAGKTTIGNLFAKRHGLPFLSVTRESEARAGISLGDLFNLGGPDAYRALENDVVKDLSNRSDRIILETAGGIVSNTPALDVILASFRTVWLKASPEEHLQRVIGQGDLRPMRGTPKALEHLKSLLTKREQEYARADCVLDTSGRTPEECADELERIAAGLVLSRRDRVFT